MTLFVEPKSGSQSSASWVLIHQLAWLCLAGVGAVALAAAHAARLEPGSLALALFTDVGPYLLVGTLLGLLEAGSRRLALPRWLRYSALLVGMFVLCWWGLQSDLGGFIARREESGSSLPWYFILSVIAALGMSLWTSAVGWLDRGWLRLLATGVAAGLAVSNHWILPRDYPGIHLLLGLAAGLSLARGASGLMVRAAGPFSRRRVARFASLALFGLGLVGVFAPAGDALQVVRRAQSGAFLLPYLPGTEYAVPDWSATHFSDHEWFSDRTQMPPRPPSGSVLAERVDLVLLLGIDSLRADVLAGRYDQQLPTLAGLRNQSVYFTHAYSPASATAATLYSVFTSRYYSQTYWSRKDDDFRRLRLGINVFPYYDESETLPALLSRAGVRTKHVATLKSITGKRGVDRGFEHHAKTKHYGHARHAMQLILDELETVAEGKLFLFCHFIDPHAPYNRGGKSGSPFERYLREVEVVDEQLTRLVEFLKERGLEQRTLLVIMADHGEAFGEHRTNFHSATIYEELVRIPLLFWGARLKPSRVDTPVSLIDLAPTILDVFNQPTLGPMMGQSLVPSLSGETQVFQRPIAFDSSRRQQGMLFPDGTKLILDLRHQTRQLYDLENDPEELNNLVDEPAWGADEKLAALRHFFEVHRLKRPGYFAPWRKF